MNANGVENGLSDLAIRRIGLVAVLGGLANIVGDLFIVTQPLPGNVGTLDFLRIMPVQSVSIGVIIGLFALASWFAVVPSLFRALSRASAIERWAAISGCCVFVAGSIALHSMFWPYAIAIHAMAEQPGYQSFLTELEGTFEFFQITIILAVLVTTLALAVSIFRKVADYPWWILLASPFLTMILFGNLVAMIPAPIGGYVAAVTTTTLSLVFIALLVFARRPAFS